MMMLLTHAGRGGTLTVGVGNGGFALSGGGPVIAVAFSFAAAFLLLGATVASGVEIDLVGGQDDVVRVLVVGREIGIGVGRGSIARRWASLGLRFGSRVAWRALGIDQSLLWWLLGLDGHLHCHTGHVLLITMNLVLQGNGRRRSNVLGVVVVVGIGGGRRKRNGTARGGGSGGGDGQGQIVEIGRRLGLRRGRNGSRSATLAGGSSAARWGHGNEL